MAYKVIQWATGPVGRAALHHIIGNPDLELVGVWVHSDSKVGVDAGDLVGLSKTGVCATTDKDAILGLDADCVIYTPKLFLDPEAMDEEVCAILRSGKNVLTTAGYWFPHLHGQDYVDRLEQACRDGGSSLFGAGENPGYFFERMAVSATGMCDTFEEVRLYEYVDCATHPSATLVFDVVGFGKPVEELEQGSPIAAALDRCYPETIGLCAQMMGIEFDSIERESSFHTAERDIEIRTGTVEKGRVSGQAHRWSAIRDGRRILTIVNSWFVERDIPGWDIQDGWRIEIEGRPSFKITIDPSPSLANPDQQTYPDIEGNPLDIITAMTTVRAIPDVVAAAPGIVYPTTPFAAFTTRYAAIEAVA
jgi:2,4-diaminopentanoate dehydrogenase